MDTNESFGEILISTYDPTYDHESHASKFQKAHILAYRINFILKEGLNMSEEHTGKPATKIFDHI